MATLIEQVAECLRIVRGVDERLRWLEERVGREDTDEMSAIAAEAAALLAEEPLPKARAAPRRNRKHYNEAEGRELQDEIVAYLARKGPTRTALLYKKVKGASGWYMKKLVNAGRVIRYKRGTYALAPQK